MAIVNLFDNTINVLGDDVQSSVVSVLDNGDTGYFFVGNVFTPKDLVGKQLLLKFELLED